MSKIPTSIEPIDRLLDGGLEFGALTNLCGAPGTGKTNICMLAALGSVKQKNKVIFIDTEGGFSLERFRQIAKNQKNSEETLKKIIFFEPKNFKEQEETVKKLEEICGKNPVGLIILDSAVALYRLEYAETDDVLTANKQLGIQLAILSMLARERNIPVVITTHVFRKFDTDKTEIIGGDAIKYWCKTMIFIEKTDEMSRRRATVIKHRSLEEGRSVEFYLTQDGIESAERKFGLF